MRRGSRSCRGQGAVEFVLMTLLLFLMMFLVVQLMWVGVQKWQFSHFTGYAARVWQVHKDDSAQDAMFSVLISSIALRWQILNKDYVKAIWVSEENASQDGTTGIRYRGVVQAFPFYQPYIGQSFTPPGVSLPFGITVPPTGIFLFESYIPIQKEAEEDEDRWDNDCKETPCGSENGQ